jgi:hypothetical protein
MFAGLETNHLIALAVVGAVAYWALVIRPKSAEEAADAGEGVASAPLTTIGLPTRDDGITPGGCDSSHSQKWSRDHVNRELADEQARFGASMRETEHDEYR